MLFIILVIVLVLSLLFAVKHALWEWIRENDESTLDGMLEKVLLLEKPIDGKTACQIQKSLEACSGMRVILHCRKKEIRVRMRRPLSDRQITDIVRLAGARVNGIVSPDTLSAKSTIHAS